MYLLPRKRYVFRDEFHREAIDPRWTKTDSGEKVSVGSGLLSFSGGVPAWNDPMVLGPAARRVAGLTAEFEVTPGAALKDWLLGLVTGTAENMLSTLIGFYPSSSGSVVYAESRDGEAVQEALPLVYAGATSYRFRVVVGAAASGAPSAGARLYYSADGGTTWKVLFVTALGTTSPLYPMLLTNNAALTSDYVRVFRGPLKALFYQGTAAGPTPEASANRVANGDFTSGANWTLDPVWAIADGVATASGSGNMYQLLELNPNLWLRVTYDVAGYASGAVRTLLGSDGTFGPNRTADGSYTEVIRAFPGLTYLYFNATGGSALSVDHVAVRQLTQSSLLGPVGDAGTREGIVVSHPTLTARTQCGHWVWVDDETSPAYGLAAYHDGTNAHLAKLVDGTWTDLIEAAASYVAGAELRTVVVNTSIALYYNGTQVLTAQTVADIWPSTGTKVCRFSTVSTNAPGEVSIYG